MDTPPLKAPEKLCAEILAQAREQAADINGQARAEAVRIRGEASREAVRIRDERLAAAEREALGRRQLLMATLPVELDRQRSSRVEALLQRIYQTARADLLARKEFDYPSTLVALASEAIGRMFGQRFVLKLNPADRVALGDQLGQAITARVGHSHLDLQVVDDPTIIDGGLCIQDSAGVQIWDDRLSARLDRLWPELRRQLATLVPHAGGASEKGGDS